MSRLKRRLLALGVFAALMVGSSINSRADVIKIGVFGPMSGDAAAHGNAEKEAVELAVKEKNAAGGIRGKQIEVIYGDDAGKPEEAVNVAKRLVARDDVSILIGSISSPASLAASQIAGQTQTPQIVVSGTAQKITTQGNKWVFRSPVPDTKLAGDLATFINEKFPSIKKVAFLYVNDDFGRGGFEAFKAKAQEYGIEIVDEERYARGDLDFTAQLGKIKASPAQALIEWSRYTEGALVAKQFQQLGMTMPRFGSDGVAIPKYIELGGEAVNGVFYMTHYSSATTGNIPAAQVFIEKFKKAYGTLPNAYNAEAYDAITIALLAIEKAGSEDKAAIRDALANVSFESVRGPFKFDSKGDPLLLTHVVKIVNGKETNGRDIAVQR
ncbi:MAG TPA: ABC transporter substrate-binding protein [Hyphomicrobiales bacterium]|nr:ABC transporter substrate-binding protein [Hyphomicrobiales bacterium]